MPESKHEMLYLRMAPHLCVMGGGDQEMLRAVELRAVILTFCGWQVAAATTNGAIIAFHDIPFNLCMLVHVSQNLRWQRTPASSLWEQLRRLLTFR